MKMGLGRVGLFAVAAGIVGATLGACSSAAEEPTSAERAGRVLVEASAETRAALGVASWEIAASETGATVVRGLDASRAVVARVELGRTKAAGFRASLELGADRATMTLEPSRGSAMSVASNTFGGSATARRAVERLRSDLEKQPHRGSATLTTKASGVSVKDLTGGGESSSLVGTDGGTSVVGSSGCLAKQCQTSLVGAAQTGTTATQLCMDLLPGAVLPPDDPCAGGARSASAQGQGVEDCTSGGADAVCRASEWVSAEMPYCGGVRGGSDAICGGTCSRSGAAVREDWDTYRSDCSGLVSWAWGLPAPGKTTLGLAPFDTSVSELTTIDALQPGDALNNEKHVMLFAGWVDKSALKATIIEEYDCGKIARQTEKQFTRASDSQLNVSYGGAFHTIRHKK